jgi:succinate-semialdehyde dehydrogenase/glutarate-semialdehyde dehydrogenase
MSASQPALSLIKSLAYVDGRWCESLGGRRFEVLNPATGQVITQVPDMDGEDTRRHRGRPRGATRLGGPHRQGAQQPAPGSSIMANQEELARIMTCEQGKPLAEAKGGGLWRQLHPVVRGRGQARLWPHHPGFSADRRLATIKQPVGVVAAITPGTSPSP